jgi:hypothetical protein
LSGPTRAGIGRRQFYSPIQTVKPNGLNPETYLAYAIDQLARGHLASRLSELLPWNCKDAVEACTRLRPVPSTVGVS